MEFKPFIIEVLKSTSEIASHNFGKVAGWHKDKDDPSQILTDTDLEIGAFVISKIQEKFPSHNIIDEEAGVIDNGSDYTWVIDPIDGTDNFAVGIPTYGTMLGLMHNYRPIAGGATLPFFDEIYYAETSKGAFCNDVKISVSQQKELVKSTVAYGIDAQRQNPEKTMKEVETLGKILLGSRTIRDSNSVFDSMMAARGKYGAVLNKTTKVWDNVAQQIIIEEAGGVYTNFYGEPMDYSKALRQPSLNYTMCAAAPILHKQLQKIIREC